jgi:hypothetical protein
MLIFKKILSSWSLERWLLVAGIIVAILNGIFFTKAYWLDADDVMFLQIGLEGWHSVIEAVKLYSTAQGRFGQNIQMPLNILASLFFANVYFRIFYVAAFFFSIMLFLRWFDTALRTRIANLAFLLAVALTPLHFYHLPPTSFPLQNTVPIVLLSLSRLALLSARQTGRPAWTALWATPVFIFAMVMSEYAFLFSTGMLAVEYLAMMSRSGRLDKAYAIIRSRFFLQDIVACIIPLAIYIAWRSEYPSGYDGNSFDGFRDPILAVKVWWLHTFGLMSLAIPQGVQAFGTSAPRFFFPLPAGLIVGLAVYKALPRLQAVEKPLLPAFLALLFALYETFPTSMTDKQQEWCRDLGACVYLDSRTAFPAAILVILFVIAAIWHIARRMSLVAYALRGGVAVIACWLTLATVAQNAWMVDNMRPRMSVWKRADKLACSIDIEATNLRALVDPKTLVEIHPHLDPNNFWRVYLRNAAKKCAPKAMSTNKRKAGSRSQQCLGFAPFSVLRVLPSTHRCFPARLTLTDINDNPRDIGSGTCRAGAPMRIGSEINLG